MFFQRSVATLALIATSLLACTSAARTTPNYAGRSLEPRIGATGCVTIPYVTINLAPIIGGATNYNVLSNLCVCIEAGALTTQSGLDIAAQISQSGGLVGGVLNTVLALTGFSNVDIAALLTNGGSQTGLLGLVGSVLSGNTILAQVLTGVAAAPACAVPYPPNSTPVCGTDCAFVCDDPYTRCGDVCITAPQTCVSGVPQRKRSFGSSRCAPGLTACPIPGRKGLQAWECVNTSSDVESCGGCLFPVSDGPVGLDCTDLEGFEGEAHCIAGRCQLVSSELLFQ